MGLATITQPKPEFPRTCCFCKVLGITPIITDFQVRTGKYKARVFKYVGNKGFVFPNTDLKIGYYRLY